MSAVTFTCSHGSTCNANLALRADTRLYFWCPSSGGSCSATVQEIAEMTGHAA